MHIGRKLAYLEAAPSRCPDGGCSTGRSRPLVPAGRGEAAAAGGRRGLIITASSRVRGSLRDPAALGTRFSPAAGEEAEEAEAPSFSALFFLFCFPTYREG